MIDSARIFVTGATGVLGRLVVPLLKDHGCRVRGLSRSPVNTALLKHLGAEAVKADLFDVSSVRLATKDSWTIVHLATKVPPLNKMKERAAWAENDRIRGEGTRNVVDAACANGVETILYPSVCLVYPDCGSRWVDAETCSTASVPAVRSTLEAEEAILRFTAGGGCGIVLRMGQFYGPESQYTQQELRLARWGLVGALGSHDSYHSLIWIKDAASAVVAALVHGTSGVYDVGDDEPLTNKERIESLAAAIPRRGLFHLPSSIVRRVAGPELSRIFSRSARVSNRRFKHATGWCPSVPSAREGWALCVHGGSP